jgi:hypothetical protein
VPLDQEHKDLYNELSEPQKKDLGEQVSLELARAKTEFVVDLPAGVTVLTGLPITNNLNEDVLIKTVKEVGENGILAAEEFDLDLKRYLQK